LDRHAVTSYGYVLPADSSQLAPSQPVGSPGSTIPSLPFPSVFPCFHGPQDITQASKYANLAVKHDRYNAKALVNMGNVLLERGDLERAKELYLEAIGVEADCVEAIFNLGLVRRGVSGCAFGCAIAAILHASTAVTAGLRQGLAALLVCA